MSKTANPASDCYCAETAAVLEVCTEALQKQIEDGPFEYENDYENALAALTRLLATVEQYRDPSA